MLRKKKIYRINDSFLFEPLLCLIKNLQTGESAVLSQSSSDCLTLLVSQPDAIVSRRDLMSYGWECYNLSVTDNNLNQNIAVLRKKFKELGLAKDIIKTVPRKGFSISSDIPVSSISESNNYEESNASDINKAVVLLDSDSGCIEEPPINKTTSAGSFFINKNTCTVTICICICIVIFIIIIFTFHKKSGKLNSCYYSSYRLLKKENKHIIFGNDEVTSDDILSALNFSKSQYIDSRYTFIYITSYKFIPRKTILYCNSAFGNSKNKDCISQYIFKN